MSDSTGWDAWTLDEELVYSEFAPSRVNGAAWPIQQMNFVSAARKLKCRPFTQQILEHKIFLEWKKEQAEKEKRRGSMDWKKEQSEKEEKKRKEKDFLEWKKDQVEKEKRKEEETASGEGLRRREEILRNEEIKETKTKMDEERRREEKQIRDEEKSRKMDKRGEGEKRMDEEEERERERNREEETRREAVKSNVTPNMTQTRGSLINPSDHPSRVFTTQRAPNPSAADAHSAGFTLWEWAIFNEFANVHRDGNTWPIEQMDGVAQQRQLACRPFTQRALNLEFRRHPHYREQLQARQAAAAAIASGRGAPRPPRRTVITLGDALRERALREAHVVRGNGDGDGDDGSSVGGGDDHDDSDAGLGSGGSERSWRSGEWALARDRAMSF